jgi:hypothetical protein
VAQILEADNFLQLLVWYFIHIIIVIATIPDILSDILLLEVEVFIELDLEDDLWGEKVNKTISPLFFKDLNYLLSSLKNKSYFYSSKKL